VELESCALLSSHVADDKLKEISRELAVNTRVYGVQHGFNKILVVDKVLTKFIETPLTLRYL
jgi:hypothetical protein